MDLIYRQVPFGPNYPTVIWFCDWWESYYGKYVAKECAELRHATMLEF